jgi:hypothetical protein
VSFADPWEHVRLLSDGNRNEAMIALLRRRAPGARVLEVGCGTGLLSCIAARLGAKHVIALEPTSQAETATRLVEENGLVGVVEVVQASVEELRPRPVDLAFSELLNADPFAEGLLSAMDAAAGWVAPGGLLAPRRLRVWAALARATDSAREFRAARAQVRALGERYGVRTRVLEDELATPFAYVTCGGTLAPAGPPTLLWDLALGSGQRAEPRTVSLVADEAGPVAGVIVWFESELDDGIVLGNPPGAGGHWGQLIAAFAEERGLRAGGGFPVEIVADELHLSFRAL